MANPSTPLTVALTGASGFVGGHVLDRLLGSGHHVRALARDPGRLGRSSTHARLTVVQGALHDDGPLTQLVESADAVVHLVGIIAEHPGRGQTFERVHVDATRRLLAAAHRAGVGRWVHMSALGSRPEAASTYHQTKWRAECAVRESGMKHTIFRPSIIHGPDGEFMQMVRGFWCRLFPPFVPYFGAGPFGTGGAGALQPVFVQDVAQCFTGALTSDRALDETYPLGGPDVLRWPDLYDICRRHLPGARSKPILGVPAWYASLIAGMPLVPFNRDQVIMSQEDSTCDIGKVQSDFDLTLAPFEPTFADYAAQIH
ncbi:MAG: hypothetical protein CMJ18_14065 [Phycisphaeraceae bacterium]|nr:hypothetical protein [Phycisphaeraceae bacterium]